MARDFYHFSILKKRCIIISHCLFLIAQLSLFKKGVASHVPTNDECDDATVMYILKWCHENGILRQVEK